MGVYPETFSQPFHYDRIALQQAAPLSAPLAAQPATLGALLLQEPSYAGGLLWYLSVYAVVCAGTLMAQRLCMAANGAARCSHCAAPAGLEPCRTRFVGSFIFS